MRQPISSLDRLSFFWIGFAFFAALRLSTFAALSTVANEPVRPVVAGPGDAWQSPDAGWLIDSVWIFWVAIVVGSHLTSTGSLEAALPVEN